MIRALTLCAVVMVSSGCAATLHSIERGEWVLVTTDDGKGQELITRDAYAGEVVAGRERMVKLAVDEKAPVLHEAPEQMSATVGEFLRFRVNEGDQVDVLSDEAVAEVSWTTNKPVDGWNGDKAVEGRQSQVYVHALKPGKGKLRLVDRTWGTHDFELTVTSKK